MARLNAEDQAGKPGAAFSGTGRNPAAEGAGACAATATREDSTSEMSQLMEAVVERENMWAALRRVKSNKGAAGVDGMTVAELGDFLRAQWPRIRQELLEDRYRPKPVRGVEIPKPGGKGMRQLGIPTVLDRLIQQALHQVLQPLFEPCFSESSYGFRPGRSAHHAVLKAREHVGEGRHWVVDMDLEKFFDRVNHDILMSRVARRVKDKRVLRLIRNYLRAGLLQDGLVSQRVEGTPQGGPLSPLLSNILLDDLDKELERRGHTFCRYADDCNIYVHTERAGQRVLASVTRFLEQKLKLRVNAEKSSIAHPWERKFLGYSMTSPQRLRLRAAPESVQRFKAKLRIILRRGRGRSLTTVIEELNPVVRGWTTYYRHTELQGLFKDLDGWIRRKLRCILWKRWKTCQSRAHHLMRRGLDKDRAWRAALNGRGPWWNANGEHMRRAFPNRYFDTHKLASLQHQWRRLQCAT